MKKDNASNITCEKKIDMCIQMKQIKKKIEWMKDVEDVFTALLFPYI